MFPTAHHLPSRNGKAGKSRLIIGGVCLDFFLSVALLVRHTKHRILRRVRTVGGGAANVALGHRQLAPERRIVLVAGTGDDSEGRTLRRHMTARRIEMPWPSIPRVATSVSYVISEADTGNGTILSEPGARALPVPLPLIEQELPAAEFCCLVAPTDNAQIAAILTLAARHRVPVNFGLGSMQVYNLSYPELQEALVEKVELMICNRGEAARLTGCVDIDDQLDALRFDGRVRTVIVTDGVKGIHALRDGERCDVPAYTDPGRPVVDDVGAGDAAQGAIVDALTRGYPLEAALQAGARQGFEACTAVGATTQLLDGTAMREYLSLAVGAGVS